MPAIRLSLAFICLTALLAGGCGQAGVETGGSRAVLRDMSAFLDQLGEEEIADRPELATRLGIPDPALKAAAARRLQDRSQAAFERRRLDRLERLHRLDRIALPPETTIMRAHFEVVRAAHLRAERVAAFGFGRASLNEARPYVIDPYSGAYIETPFLLLHVQTVRSMEEAEAYLARLSQLADEIEDERRRLIADAEAGVSPPVPLLRATQESAAALGDIPAEAHPLLTTLEDWLSGADVSPEEASRIAEQARRLLQVDVLPAYARLRATLNALTIGAPEAPGVWALENGRAYYLAALAFHTTRDTAPDALRTAAQAETEQLKAALIAELDALAAQGETDALIITEADNPDTPAPQASLETRLSDLLTPSGEEAETPAAPEEESPLVSPLALLRQQVSAWRSGSERLVNGVAAAPGVSLVETHAAFPQTGVGLSYQSATLDRTAPAQLFIPADAETPSTPLFTARLRAQTWPGRHMMHIAASETAPPVIRLASAHTAYESGWAAYALELAQISNGRSRLPAQERIGLLQARLINAAAVIVDVDIHLNRLSHAEASAFLSETTGLNARAALQMTGWISAHPGESASAFAGMEALRDLRRRSESVLRNRFDLAEFHAVILAPGPRPLDQVEADIEQWYDSRLNAAP